MFAERMLTRRFADRLAVSGVLPRVGRGEGNVGWTWRGGRSSAICGWPWNGASRCSLEFVSSGMRPVRLATEMRSGWARPRSDCSRISRRAHAGEGAPATNRGHDASGAAVRAPDAWLTEHPGTSQAFELAAPTAVRSAATSNDSAADCGVNRRPRVHALSPHPRPELQNQQRDARSRLRGELARFQPRAPAETHPATSRSWQAGRPRPAATGCDHEPRSRTAAALGRKPGGDSSVGAALPSLATNRGGH